MYDKAKDMCRGMYNDMLHVAREFTNPASNDHHRMNEVKRFLFEWNIDVEGECKFMVNSVLPMLCRQKHYEQAACTLLLCTATNVLNSCTYNKK
jgi:hypothetical protein